ncbi:hypothetical protein PAXRUDRAFT_29470 [Paxillus rubicundulus Ve08.2h10]|uniref:Unplaced genomic scaffold scaffold_2, whole genome shotgun sequence n=1 Tax=Paxillus rubicundulus Ve08.2h10 TaxID=930991 RepID=A0A0D0DPI0_9AGAM|nr:hypothetical protein PAXRUDRAFT_29470 [Paxillus rubicundulus Ve08.2h10]
MLDHDLDPEQDMMKSAVCISFCPSYQSDEAQEMYNVIDAIPNPNSDLAQMILPNAKTIDNTLRAWQVKASILEANPHWMTTSCVLKNGVLWGSTEDPQPNNKKQKLVLSKKPLSKCPRVEIDLVEEGKAPLVDHLCTLTTGQDKETLFGFGQTADQNEL